MDFSIIIAHRGDPMGLWATIESCQSDLAATKFNFTYNFVIVSNGEVKPQPELKRIIEFVKRAGRLKEFIHVPDVVSAPNARQLGVEHADGELLFFFDNHCLVGRDYFARAVLNIEKYRMDMLHSTTKFYTGEQIHYHYRLRLARNFWAMTSFIPRHPYLPYRIAAAGHGGFVVRRSVWDEVGGYWDGFVGYGGEEMYFDLKMALLDKTNWIDPRLVHYHFAGRRGYARHYTDDFYRNMLMCANIIGGMKWMYRVYESFTRWLRIKDSGLTMYDIMMQAEERSREHAKYLASIRHRTLDEQLDFFRRNQIAYE